MKQSQSPSNSFDFDIVSNPEFLYEEFKKAGLEMVFIQDNHSKSKKGMLRGCIFKRNTLKVN